MQSEGVPRKETREDLTDWRSLAEQIGTGDSPCPNLWAAFEPGLRIFFSVHLRLPARQFDDKIHRVLSAVTVAARAGQLQDPAGLPALVLLTARRFLDQDIHSNNTCLLAGAVDARPNRAPTIEARRALRALTAIEREILVRYYGNREEPERICAELHIHENEFRKRKDEAKRRFQKLVSRDR